jgi:serine protease Do
MQIVAVMCIIHHGSTAYRCTQKLPARPLFDSAVLFGLMLVSAVTFGQAVAAEVDAVGVQAPPGFAEVVARVKPAVVGIQVTIEESASSDEIEPKAPFPPGSPLDRFFRRFGAPNSDSSTAKSGTAVGSGFFVTSDGDIVTNEHLVAKGKRIEVTTDSGTTYDAKVVGVDPQSDLALIKVGAVSDFPYVRLAAGTPRIGDWVLAIGNPFGLGGTVTAGIVSASGRDIGGGAYDDLIQIDAPVNLGNSGGPTFNVRGEVIGVNTAIFSPSGGSIGVAFDIPAETVEFVVGQLKNKGHVTRGWIGVQVQSVTPPIAEALGLKHPEGALVADLEQNTPAAKGGIEIGDVITSVNGEPIKELRDLSRKIAAITPGTLAKFGVFRSGQERMLTVVIGKFPQKPAEARAAPRAAPREPPVLGLQLAPASTIAAAGGRGVVVTDVSPASRAGENGIQVGDVILDVGRRPVNEPADVRKTVEEARMQSKQTVLLRVRRGDTVTFVAIPVA